MQRFGPRVYNCFSGATYTSGFVKNPFSFIFREDSPCDQFTRTAIAWRTGTRRSLRISQERKRRDLNFIPSLQWISLPSTNCGHISASHRPQFGLKQYQRKMDQFPESIAHYTAGIHYRSPSDAVLANEIVREGGFGENVTNLCEIILLPSRPLCNRMRG
jgi:hypothetical protein